MTTRPTPGSAAPRSAPGSPAVRGPAGAATSRATPTPSPRPTRAPARFTIFGPGRPRADTAPRTDPFAVLPATFAALREAQRAASVRLTEPVEYPTPPPVGEWGPDVLGEGFEARTLPLADDDEGAVVATLVRVTGASARAVENRAAGGTPGNPDDDGAPRTLRDGLERALRAVRDGLTPGPADSGDRDGETTERPEAPPSFALLYVHGWNDYFFQTELAHFWHDVGGAFYALDLRKYGRSLRANQSPGYVEDLETYDEDLEAALAIIADEHGPDLPLVINAHSTGGLVTALWAHRNPGRVAALVLNSPWLEVLGTQFVRNLSMPVIEQLARMHPRTPLPFVDPGYYTRSLDAAQGGEWTIDERWRFPESMPVRPGWLRAILAGHARVAVGLAIEAPILVLTSARTLINPVWSEEMRSADIVLDVDLVGRRALNLGPVVTVVRVEGALHDVILSARPARERAYAEIRRWVRAYVENH